MTFTHWRRLALLAAGLCIQAALPFRAVGLEEAMKEKPYVGELLSYPGAWSFQLGKEGIILVSDQEFKALDDPDKVLNLSLTFDKQEGSLRQVCERARAAGHRTLILAFDHFFSQYRPGQAGPRKLTPDMDEYVARIGRISRFAAGYGLGLELSLLNPLEIGTAYARQTGESGVWMHYREGVRDVQTGAYSVNMWRQKQWANNKGIISLVPAGVRVFAYREQPIRNTSYRVVNPTEIREITATAHVQVLTAAKQKDRPSQIRIHGTGEAGIGPLDRVLVVQSYKTPEMDYFSKGALPYLKALVDKYADSGVQLNALYSDECHIQQDWDYFGHHDNGEFAMRYVTPNLAARYAQLFGKEYTDFARYLVYFCQGQEDTARDLSAKADIQHVFGAGPEEIRRTALFRARYYKLLQDQVVDLFTAAKTHAENRMGHMLESRAHATWAESPTIDNWRSGPDNMYSQAYEYTSNFVWSNTVHQAASACYDYFKWGDFLTGNGNDHAECGWLDRNYLGLALACSTGIINKIPYSYGAHWGSPAAIAQRREACQSVFGAAGSPLYGLVQDMEHRDVDVLMLYPMDLVAVNERFGSWMAQYGYANLITPTKLLEMGKVDNGGISLGGRRFTTLVATFEPFPAPGLLEMMRKLADQGGRVIWSGPPPVLSATGSDILKEWQSLFGARYTPGLDEGRLWPGRQITFSGPLASVAPQVVLTDLLPDRVYPMTATGDATPVASCSGQVVGVSRRTAARGSLTALGFRPRDDQSASLGYETRTWYTVLKALGAYAPTGAFVDVDDNTEVISRTTGYLACRFPNGAVAIAPHLKDVPETWSGGFARNAKEDEEAMKGVALPDEHIRLSDLAVNGHRVTYDGGHAMAFRVDATGRLVAYAGNGATSITVDGAKTVFADRPVSQMAFGPVRPDRRIEGGALVQAMIYGEAEIRLPVPPGTDLELWSEGAQPGSRGKLVPSRRDGDTLVFMATAEVQGRWLYAAPSRPK